MTQLYQDKLAQLYDVAVPDWPGEIDFYRRLAHVMAPHERSVLDVACGTGRIAIKLAAAGVKVLGIDLSDEMLDIARAKSANLACVRWTQADMRSFSLGERFGLAIVPAYSFQLLLTESDQASCLTQISKHLSRGARLVLHLELHDPDWLSSLPSSRFTPFELSGETIHPDTGELIRVSYAWSNDPITRSVGVIIRYETIANSNRVTHRTERDPLKMHCTSPRVLQRLLAQSGFETDAIYGDFNGSPFDENADEMIWIAKKDTEL